jgi:hypothetical protein
MIDGWILVLVLSFMSSVWGLTVLLIQICRAEPLERSTDMHCAPVADRGSTADGKTPDSVHWRSTIAVRDGSCTDSPRFAPANRTSSLPGSVKW